MWGMQKIGGSGPTGMGGGLEGRGFVEGEGVGW